MEWKTRITELLGCKYPIMEGGLSGIGTWKFAAAVSETGAEGCLTAACSRTPEKLREHIAKIREVTDKPFAVNITIGMCPHIDEMLDVCIQEKVHCIETAVFNPDKYYERIKEAGIIWIHKAATVDHIKRAESLGADAVVLVGLDGYGFKNIRQLPTFTAIAWAKRHISIPLVAAGGIGNARTLLSALLAGADAVYMGSALMATEECPISDKVKRNMMKATPDHPDLIRELLAPPKPDDYKEVMEARKTMPFEKWIPALERVMLKHDEWKDVDTMWEMAEHLKEEKAADVMPSLGSRPKGPFSFSCGYIDKILPVKDFIENMTAEAEETMERLVNQWQLGSEMGS